MSFLAPWALWVAGAVSAAVIALHILASKNPKVTALPTTRFIPDVPLRATARAMRLSDLLLMLLRVAVVMMVGVAVARPELSRARRAVGRVVMVDVSRAVASRAELSDSASRLFERGDVLIVFDSSARAVRNASADSIARTGSANNQVPGSISAALAAGMRAASSMRGEADSVELVLISPLAAEEVDRATLPIRAMWRGRLRVVRVAPVDVRSAAGARPEVINASLDDPVRAASSSLGDVAPASAPQSRIDRGPPANADSSWAMSGAHTLVRWPAALDSSGWSRRARADTAGSVLADAGENEVVVVSTFPRVVDAAPGRAIAWWTDGSPAATERRAGGGCIRDVAIPIARVGDLALRESTRALVRQLSSPCGGPVSIAPASDSVVAQLRGTGPLAATRALDSRTSTPSPLATWLLVAALALLLVEPLLRRQRAAA